MMMEKSGNQHESSIYGNDFQEKQYTWQKTGKRLAHVWRILQILIVQVGFVVTYLWLLFGTFSYGMIGLAGALGIMAALLLAFMALGLFLNNLFVVLSRKLSPEGRHDFILYRYHHGMVRKESARTPCLFSMAKIDLTLDRGSLARNALKEIHVDKLNGAQMKLYALMWMNVCLADGETEDGETAQDWYHMYTKIPEASGRFPSDETVVSWLENGQREEMQKAAESLLFTKIALVSPLLLGLMAAHGIFYLTLLLGLTQGWSLRRHYARIAAPLTVACFLIIGASFLWRLYHMYRHGKGKTLPRGKKILAVLGGIAWAILVIHLAQWIMESSLPVMECQETILAENVTDAQDHRTYIYLKVEWFDGIYMYYRAPDSMFMEEYAEAAEYNPALQDTEDSTDAEGLDSKAAMLAVYDYLEASEAYPDLQISFWTTEEGEPFAQVAVGLENRDETGIGTVYELCLYENGQQETESGTAWEIVLEKEYPNGEKETERLDSYFVDSSTGEVTDENETGL